MTPKGQGTPGQSTGTATPRWSGRADPEALAELERAALDAARVDELENVALQLLGCILEAV